MGERENRLVDPRAPVILTAKVSRAQADDIFFQANLKDAVILEASSCLAAWMARSGFDSVTFFPDELAAGRRLAPFMTRHLDGGAITLKIRGQHEGQEHEGPPANGLDKPPAEPS